MAQELGKIKLAEKLKEKKIEMECRMQMTTLELKMKNSSDRADSTDAVKSKAQLGHEVRVNATCQVETFQCKDFK